MVKLQALVFFVVCAGISNAGISIINNEVIDTYSNDCYGIKCALTDASCQKRVDSNPKDNKLLDVSIACLDNRGQVTKSNVSQVPANTGGFFGNVHSVVQHSINVNKEQEEAIIKDVFSRLNNILKPMFGPNFLKIK